ncbi:MAG TPA: HRDC domain-containing protein [Kofleriaceae bacterium]
MRLTADAAEIAAIAEALARAPLVAFDLEFVSADRLVPLLALVQVAWVGQHQSLDAAPAQIVAQVPDVRLVDPLAGDVAPIIRALAAHPCVIAHAPRQDLALLATRFGAELPGLVDTQLMAAFAGHGDQIGYASLANELLGTSLAKDQQWTSWDKRPLTDAQVAYAEADVRHLPAIYARLAAELGDRLAWVRAETASIGADALAAARVTPETAWQHVGGARTLDGDALAAVMALAAWRQRTAIELDRPLGQVLGDKSLVELARHRPASAGGVRETKGLSPLAKARADAIAGELAAVKRAPRGATPGATPGATAGGPTRAASMRAQRWAEALIAIAHVVADEAGVAPRLIATRADAEEFARAVDEHGVASPAVAALPALASWRRPLLGEIWVGWLEGRLALVGDAANPHGVKLVTL